jgi:8-oxo-dGTP pyrophosphatase MutT (NUDIX family)
MTNFDTLVSRLLGENHSPEGVEEENGIIRFYNTFKDDSYHDIRFSKTIPDFKSLNDTPFDEPEARVSASGVILVEPDGRIWIRKVANNYGGYIYSFAKGRIEKGYTIQQNAIKETFEETGFVSRINSWLTDIQGDTSVTRFYLGSRIGGHPSFFGQQDLVETEFIVLTDKANAMKLLNKDRDKQVLSML